MANHKKSKKNKKKLFDPSFSPPYPAALLATPLEKLSLQEGTYNLLKNAGFVSLKEILSCRDTDFYKIMTFNKKNLYDLKAALAPFKAQLRTDEDKAIPKQKDKRKEKDNRQQSEKETEKEVAEPDIYVKINRGGKWGFADRQGKEVIKAVYDNVFTFSEELCCVEKDELFGYIDRKGNEVIPVQYECAFSFSEGLACVYKKDLCGYIDKNNNVIIDFRFDAGTPFEQGGCRVKKDGKWAELMLKDTSSPPAEMAEYTLRWIN